MTQPIAKHQRSLERIAERTKEIIENTENVTHMTIMLESMDVYDSIQPTTERKKAIKAAIKALEQEPQCTEHPCLGTLCKYYKEPCEDAISREAGIKVIRQKTSKYTLAKENCGMGQVEWSDHLIKESDAIDGLNELPSVTPKSTECEYAISRADAIDQMEQSYNILDATDRIKALPPVTPSRRKGHWIEEDMWDDIAYRCSECDEVFCLIDGTPELNDYHYCPNCGAEMESEE